MAPARAYCRRDGRLAATRGRLVPCHGRCPARSAGSGVGCFAQRKGVLRRLEIVVRSEGRDIALSAGRQDRGPDIRRNSGYYRNMAIGLAKTGSRSLEHGIQVSFASHLLRTVGWTRCVVDSKLQWLAFGNSRESGGPLSLSSVRPTRQTSRTPSDRAHGEKGLHRMEPETKMVTASGPATDMTRPRRRAVGFSGAETPGNRPADGGVMATTIHTVVAEMCENDMSGRFTNDPARDSHPARREPLALSFSDPCGKARSPEA